MSKQEENEKSPIYQLSENELIDYADTDLEDGLEKEEAQSRLEQNGYNEIEHEKTPKWKMLVRQLNNVVIYILIAAAIITMLMGSTADSIIIMIVIVVNTLIGYYQEANASDALDEIRNMLSTEATVIRQESRKDIEARELVVGDLVYIEAGDQVPADLRIIDSDNLKIQESSLTGEADSVDKNATTLDEERPLAERENMAFSSTSVTNGTGFGIVVAVAEDTEIGKISTEVSQVEETKTPLLHRTITSPVLF